MTSRLPRRGKGGSRRMIIVDDNDNDNDNSNNSNNSRSRSKMISSSSSSETAYSSSSKRKRKWPILTVGVIVFILFLCFQVVIVLYVLPLQILPLPPPPLPSVAFETRQDSIEKQKQPNNYQHHQGEQQQLLLQARNVSTASLAAAAETSTLTTTTTTSQWPDTMLIDLWNQIRMPTATTTMTGDDSFPLSSSSSHHMVIGNFISPQPFPPASNAHHHHNHTYNKRDMKKIYIQQQLDIQNDIALLTHLDTNHFPNLVTQMEYWGINGPIEVAIYMSSIDDIHKFGQFVRQQKNNITTSSTNNNQRTTYHILLEKHSPQHVMDYPHNRLRNIVLQHSKYDYFVALDVDFIPTRDAYNGIRKLIFGDGDGSNKIQSMLQHQSVFVLPSFHMDPIVGEDGFARPNRLPQTRNELIRAYTTPVVSTGGDTTTTTAAATTTTTTVQDYTKNKLSHGATEYEKWIKLQPFDEEYYEIHPGQYFEPYILGYRRGMPSYWDEFRGFGFNKQSWHYELIKSGYTYYVLRDFFVVHLNHPQRKGKLHSRSQNKPLWEIFNKHLENKYDNSKTR